nr:hypothetical protein Iba_chr01aCG13900 [Ipomoea batatas]
MSIGRRFCTSSQILWQGLHCSRTYCLLETDCWLAFRKGSNMFKGLQLK